MKKRDIFEAALELEWDGHDFYLEIADRASNEVAAKTFRSFAKDEEMHIEWINNTAADEPSEADPDAVKQVYARLEGIFAEADDISTEGSVAEDIEGINIAIGKEEESIKAYSEWAQEAEDEETAELFEILTDFEKKHRTLLNNAKEYLQSTGDWFMEDEGWIFDGG